ncbi:MAG TPA: MBL fold metallo-hydrolase [Bacteroidales bacterium]|nr:MBL fold metallo-hydrolase [Bacteroidales bacterium]
MVIHRLVFSPIEVNTYVLEDVSGDCAVIDCGCYDEGEFSNLENFLNERKLKPVLLLNTHMHLDHIFGNRLMLQKYNLSTWSSELDEMNRKMAIQHAAIFGLSMDEPPVPAGYLQDGETVKFGSVELKALLVPGHTSGSLAYYSGKENCVFTGDALFAGSIGRSDLPGGNHETLITSIKTKLFTLPPDTGVYPGHGEKTDIKTEMRYNPYFS